MTEMLVQKNKFSPKINFKKDTIDLTHGSGGRATQRLIDQLFCKEFANPWLDKQNDAADFLVENGRMVMATDAHVISPLFFPGGDIGSLSVYGTINDLSMLGAKPLYLSASFIIEEGFSLNDLQKIVSSMAYAARQVNTPIITGDTKVVERGKGDGVFITTTGIGKVAQGLDISSDKAQVGDHIIISGYIGDHGIAVMSLRNNLQFGTELLSDSAPLNDLVARMLEVSTNIHCLRDPTRGGLATALNEIAKQSNVGMLIDESKIPCRIEVKSACELLGLDPLYVANEGKCIIICKSQDSQALLEALHSHPNGKHAAIIGEVTNCTDNFVQLKTNLGGKRVVDWLVGEQLPRIC